MNRFIKYTICFVALLINCSAKSSEPVNVPQLINYQGYLSDAQNQAKVGTVNLSFEIYDAATGGTKTWGPQVFNNVPLVNGYFNVILGTTDQNGKGISEAFSANTAFLQVFDNGTPILPRQQVLSSAYALKLADGMQATNGTTGIKLDQAGKRVMNGHNIETDNAHFRCVVGR